jgi:hypothetical protein
VDYDNESVFSSTNILILQGTKERDNNKNVEEISVVDQIGLLEPQ